jgi:hypothetical protein
MATERRAANRANAAKSTGPRTAAGKARVAQNGCRHGLNRPAGRDPAFAGDIEAWARKICRLPAAPAAGECPDPRLALELHLARRIAEAQVEVRRVRLARHRMQETALANPKYRSWRGNRARIEMLGQVGELRRLGIPLPDEMVQAFHHRHEGVEKFALILADHSGELFAFDRYERRALSRRNSAMRAFTEAQVVLAGADARDSPIDASSEVALDLSLNRLLERNRRKLAALLRLVWHGPSAGRRLLKRAVAHKPGATPALSSPSPLVGEGRSGGSQGCDGDVPHPATPTPDSSPAEPRYSEGSAPQQSDRSRQQPTSVGGGEKNAHRASCNRPAARQLTRADCPPQALRSWDHAPGGEGSVAFWRTKAKEAKALWAAGAADRAAAAAKQAEKPKLSLQEAARRVRQLLKLDEDEPKCASAAAACRPP